MAWQMSFRHSLKALLAFVLLIAASLSAPMAMAMPVPISNSGHSAEAMADCPSMPVSGDDGSQGHDATGELCCAATCVGTANAPSAALQIVPAARQPTLSTVPAFLGILSEIATPPPRFA